MGRVELGVVDWGYGGVRWWRLGVVWWGQGCGSVGMRCGRVGLGKWWGWRLEGGWVMGWG